MKQEKIVGVIASGAFPPFQNPDHRSERLIIQGDTPLPVRILGGHAHPNKSLPEIEICASRSLQLSKPDASVKHDSQAMTGKVPAGVLSERRFDEQLFLFRRVGLSAPLFLCWKRLIDGSYPIPQVRVLEDLPERAHLHIYPRCPGLDSPRTLVRPDVADVDIAQRQQGEDGADRGR